MPTTKPTQPSIIFPDNFGTSASNVKTPYTSQELIDGYSASVQQIYDGGNLNYFLGGVFQNMKYLNTFANWLNNTTASYIPYINSSNQLDQKAVSDFQMTANMSQSVDTSTTKYPSNNAVYGYLGGKANTSLDNITSAGQQKLTAVGMVVPFAGNTAPAGWLICDGSAISRTTYSALFSVIGTTYGSGDGSTTFNLPNFTYRQIGTSIACKGNDKALGLQIGTYKTANVYAMSTVVSSHNTVLFASGGKVNSDSPVYLIGDPSSSGIVADTSNLKTSSMIIKY